MSITTAAVTEATKALNGESITAFNNANAYIGVGDSTTAFSAAQTDLQASSNKVRVGMDSTYPQRSTLTVTYRATFSTSQGNFAWQEWGVFNAAAAGTMLNRKVESLGTKASTQSWQFTVAITFAAG